MPTVIPMRRRKRPRRRSPLARLGRAFGLLALGALIGTAVALAAPDRVSKSPPAVTVTRGAVYHPPAASTLAGFATVIDGDTLRIGGEKIRISGIDAPELQQNCRDAQGRDWACGRAARQRMAALIHGREVSCTARGRDRYGRMLAVCAAGGTADLGGALVRAGYALDYRRYTSDYLAAEHAARAERRGIWQGKFEPPEDWRRRHPWH